MSNSSTLTSCLADLIKFPIPAFLANRSLSLIVSPAIPFEVIRSGDALRVGGSDDISMSIMMDERFRSAGSRGNIGRREDLGLDGAVSFVGSPFVASSRWTVDGRSNDHERTRSNARAWQPQHTQSEINSGGRKKWHTPIRQNTRAICRTKLNSARPDISLVPLAACKVFDFSCENKSARLGSS